MDKIGVHSGERLLSKQVSGTRYFFLNLGAKPAAGLSPALGGRESCNPDYTINRRSYAYAGLEYVAEGEGELRLDAATHRLSPGSVFAYGRNTHCDILTDPRRPMLKYFVSLAGTGASRRLQRCGVGPGQLRELSGHAAVRGLFDDLIEEGQRAGRLTRRLCAARLEVLLLKIEEQLAQGPARRLDPARERFLRCKALIDERARDWRTLDEIARACGLEVSSVCRLFRRFEHASPYQYLLKRKMTLAAEDLIENGGLVKEAARRIGFTDPYHFSRCFRAVHGVPPRELLRHRQGE